MKYCNSLTKFSRFKTRVVKAGNIAIGGENPIRIQYLGTDSKIISALQKKLSF